MSKVRTKNWRIQVNEHVYIVQASKPTKALGKAIFRYMRTGRTKCRKEFFLKILGSYPMDYHRPFKTLRVKE